LLNNGCGNAGFENSNLDQITIYPNPSNGIFQLNSNYVIKEVQAFDIAGKSIPVQLSNNTLKLNAESGSYILKLTTDYGISTQRIQLNK
jgi:hypothetical protein